MKPTANQFPKVDCNYHSVTVDGFNGRCATRSTGFWRFSRDYFAKEANHSLFTEVASLVVVIVTAALPLASTLYVMRNLWALGAF
jgi:hypothetical protein